MTASWPIARARIRPLFPSRLFVADPAGEMANVAAIDLDLTDFVAWFDDDPTAFFWLHDPHASPILNPGALDFARWHGRPAILHSTPAAFVTAGCEGSVLLLTDAWSIRSALAGIERLIVDDRTLKRRIEAAYRPAMPAIKTHAGLRNAA